MTAALMEEKRLAFLAAVFQGDGTGAVTAARQALAIIEEDADPGEATQKATAQLRRSILVFRKKKGLDAAGTPELKKLERGLAHRLALLARHQNRRVVRVGETAWRTALGLSADRVTTLLSTLTSLQLSVGCSHFCRRCNEWALPGVRKHFDLGAVKELIATAHRAGNRDFCLYCASDPLDWRDGDATIADVLAFMERAGIRLRYGLLTKVPKGSENIVRQLVERQADFAVSLTAGNRERLRRLEARLSPGFAVQHDFEELLIPAGLDEDFESVKSSITDNYGTEITPEGAFLVVPTFTSALYPTGQCRIPVTADTPFFLERRTGRPALLVEYFKPLAAVDAWGRSFVLDRLLDVQVETLLLDRGSGRAVPPGMSDLAAFFETFEAPAIHRRRQMLAAVVKRHRQHLLIDTAPPDQDGFRHRVRDYVSSCRTADTRRLKVAAFSFLLQAVRKYCRTHRGRIPILRRLRGAISAPDFAGAELGRLIRGTDRNQSLLFQQLADCLLTDADHPDLVRFLSENPARHDPVTGRYCPDTD
jgi:hypothetical protein